jgi:hypothetical protein
MVVQEARRVLAQADRLSHGLPRKRPGASGAMAVQFDNDASVEPADELARLKQEHRDLDGAIDALEVGVVADQLQIQRLKKRKLSLRDRISYLEDQITPDIIA